MGLIKNENYITIQGWMINELHLSGNTLLVYAIIYGYSQDNESSFKGSLQYLADWCNATKQGIQKNLKELLERGLISKQEHIINNQKFCEYSCIPCNKVVYPMQQSCINNIEDNIGNKISNKLDISEPVEKMKEGKSLLPNVILQTPRKSKKQNNLYLKCIDEIMQYTNNIVLREKLKEYLDLRLQIAKDEAKPFYTNMFKGLLNDLDRLTDNTETAIKIVEQSIKKGWKGFYELKEYNKSTVKSHPAEKNVVCDKKSDEELDLADEVY